MFYDYDYHSDGDVSWDNTEVEFLRPDGGSEGKDVQWCLDHNFFEVEEGVWSGDWYYESHPEEKRLHPLRLKRTREIRQRAQQRRLRVRNQRARNESVEEEQRTAFIFMLMRDIVRQMGGSAEDVVAGESSAPFQSPQYQNVSGHSKTGVRKWTRTKPRDKSRVNNKKPGYEKNSDEDKELKKIQLLDNVICWAEGDQGIVDRARAAIKEFDGRADYKCPCCAVHFPSPEIAELHFKNSSGEGHTRHRREAGIPEPPKFDNQIYQEFKAFHLKNDDKHRQFRMENGLAEEWEQDLPERFPCPVCQKWYLSSERMEEHWRTETGRAHNRYRRDRLEGAGI